MIAAVWLILSGLLYSLQLSTGITQCIPQEVTEKLAQLYRLPAQDFMDAYNRFLQSGQAEMIRAYRLSLGLGTKPFARKMGIPIRSLQERERASAAKAGSGISKEWQSSIPIDRRKCMFGI